MKLSSALLLNGMLKPQGKWNASVASKEAPCAIGGALQIVGKQSDSIGQCYNAFGEEWPWTYGANTCPVCGEITSIVFIIHTLNDMHGWTRAQIAEWVATVEPQESVTSSAEGSIGGEVEHSPVSTTFKSWEYSADSTLPVGR